MKFKRIKKLLKEGNEALVLVKKQEVPELLDKIFRKYRLKELLKVIPLKEIKRGIMSRQFTYTKILVKPRKYVVISVI